MADEKFNVTMSHCFRRTPGEVVSAPARHEQLATGWRDREDGNDKQENLMFLPLQVE